MLRRATPMTIFKPQLGSKEQILVNGPSPAYQLKQLIDTNNETGEQRLLALVQFVSRKDG